MQGVKSPIPSAHQSFGSCSNEQMDIDNVEGHMEQAHNVRHYEDTHMDVDIVEDNIDCDEYNGELSTSCQVFGMTTRSAEEHTTR